MLESLQTEKICDRPGRDISPLRLAELGHKKKDGWRAQTTKSRFFCVQATINKSALAYSTGAGPEVEAHLNCIHTNLNG